MTSQLITVLQTEMVKPFVKNGLSKSVTSSYPERFFSVIAFFSQTYFHHKKLFYNTHQLRCYNFFIVEIIVESLNFIKMLKQNGILCHHDGEQKVHLKTQSNKKDVLVIFILQERISNLFNNKSCTQVKRKSNAI